ncbi:MAG: type I-E CRISPR-associated protein Cse2/CasB [bacterium]
MTIEKRTSEAVGVGSLVNQISGLLARGGGALSTGDVAALRRMDPRSPAAAFFKLVGLVLDQHISGAPHARLETETRWAAIIVGLAHLGDLHRRGMRLGRSLVDAGFSELRFDRLLRADADRLIDELPMLARFLSAKGVPADWESASLLILSAGRSDEEDARRRLARDYYGAQAKANSESSTERP